MIRLLISPTRSGSTAFLRCFENNPHVTQVYHQPIKSGYRHDGSFDYGFFSLDEKNSDSIHVAKETVGGFERPETEFSPIPPSLAQSKPTIADRFPSVDAIERTRPLFMFRDPLQTWASIKRLNDYSRGRSPFHSPFAYFVASFRNVYEFMQYARSIAAGTLCVTLELLAEDPAVFFRALCARWEIPFDMRMVEWELPYGIRTEYSEETRDRMMHDARFKRSKEELEASSRFRYRPSPVDDVDPEHTALIERELRPLYREAQTLALADFPQP